MFRMQKAKMQQTLAAVRFGVPGAPEFIGIVRSLCWPLLLTGDDLNGEAEFCEKYDGNKF